MPLLETKRLFAAIQLPSSLKKSFETYQKELKRAGADVKWVEPENIHLTLKFLGSTPADKIEAIAKTLSQDFAGAKRFDATLNQLGCFPSLHAPRVIWAGLLDEKNNLKRLADITQDSLLKLG